MIRGTTFFKCDVCGNKFTAPDIEYMATAFSAPQRCTKCGSMHTMPVGISGILGKLDPQRMMYKKIWESMDKNS